MTTKKATRERKASRFFPDEEYADRRERVRRAMEEHGMDACLITSPENIYYLCGLDHMGYFAYQMLALPLEGEPILVTRAMERATVMDQVPDVRHVGYSDGVEPPPEPPEPTLEVAGPPDEGAAGGLKPASMSFGDPTREVDTGQPRGTAAVRTTCRALEEGGLGKARLGVSKTSTFLPPSILEGIVEGLPGAKWIDAAGLVDDCRIVQSARELKCTRRAAELSDSMMLAAIAAAGRGVNKREVMAAIYDAMFRRGGTYPGFVPLVRATRTLSHEHGTWEDVKLKGNDLLFLEMAGCIRRYHAPMGRLVFVGKAPRKAQRTNEVCREAMMAAAERIAPGVKAGEVYEAWQGSAEPGGAVGLSAPPLRVFRGDRVSPQLVRGRRAGGAAGGLGDGAAAGDGLPPDVLAAAHVDRRLVPLGHDRGHRQGVRVSHERGPRRDGAVIHAGEASNSKRPIPDIEPRRHEGHEEEKRREIRGHTDPL